MKLRLPNVLLATVLASSAMAETYDCTTQNFGIGGWVGDRYLLAFDRKSGAGSAYGWAIHQVHKTPIPVDVENPSDGRWEFRYSVEGIKASNSGSKRVSYKVVLNTKANRFFLSGRLHGSDNQISGSGTCKRVE